MYSDGLEKTAHKNDVLLFLFRFFKRDKVSTSFRLVVEIVDVVLSYCFKKWNERNDNLSQKRRLWHFKIMITRQDPTALNGAEIDQIRRHLELAFTYMWGRHAKNIAER